MPAHSIHKCLSHKTAFPKHVCKGSWINPFCFVTGNLWEELKDDSLAVDPLVLISSSPTSSQCFPSHCQMENSSSSSNVSIQHGTPHSNMPDLQLTTLYSAFMELDTVSPAYLSNSGSKPIALMWTTQQPNHYSYLNTVLNITHSHLVCVSWNRVRRTKNVSRTPLQDM